MVLHLPADVMFSRKHSRGLEPFSLMDVYQLKISSCAITGRPLLRWPRNATNVTIYSAHIPWTATSWILRAQVISSPAQ
jgi:hypothetical protein